MKTLVLIIGSLLIAGSMAEAKPTDNPLQGGLRLQASFESGKPELDVGPGEKRLSRIWSGADYGRAPDDTFGDRLALSELLGAGHNSKYSFATKADVGLRALGTLNLQSGTFAGWFRKGAVFKNGGLLLAAKAWPTGGPRGTIHWALGIGGAPGSDVPAQKLFVFANGVQSIAVTDLPEGDWVHLAAVWDAAHGAKLYANGKLLSSDWSQNLQSGQSNSAALRTPAAYPKGNLVDEIVKWRASQGTTAGRESVPLQTAVLSGVKVSREKSTASGETLRLEISSPERLQIRSTTPVTLGKGAYEVLLRIRRDLAVSGAGSMADVSARASIRGAARPSPELTALRAVTGAPVGQINLAQKIGVADGDSISFDLNFNKPGVYFIEELSVRAAREEQQAGRTVTSLKLPSGILPTVTNLESYPVDRFHLMPSADGAVDDLAVFDFPLNAQGIQELFTGKIPDYSHAEATASDKAARLAQFGWTRAQTAGLIPLASGKNLNLRQAAVAVAKENRRATGWMAVDGFPASQAPWDYHGYTQGVQKTVHLAFDNAPPINYIVGQGTFIGLLEEGSSIEPVPNPLLKLQPDGLSYRHFFEKPIELQNLTLRRQEGVIDEIGFYSIAEGAAQASARDLTFELQAARNEIPLQDVKREEFVSAYTVRDRETLVGVANAQGQAEIVLIPALQTFHLMSPAMTSDFALGAIQVALHGKSAAKSARLHVVVHDARTPWRELARLEFTLQKNASEFDAFFNLDLRDTLISKGDTVWLSLTCDEPLEITTGAASKLTLHAAADAAKATKLWRDWELNSVRDSFESISEPRPWFGVGPDKESSWWLAAATPEYERIDTTLRLLRERFPDDEIVRSWFAFTHPNTPNPAAGMPLPAMGVHPRWAVLLKENLRLYKQFLNWWIDNRSHPNGEWGNFYGDDTDLLQDWLDGALISDPNGRIAHSLRNSADAVWNRFKLNDGRPVIEDGLNNRWTDLLHAYEEGINIQPQTFVLDYGDPELLARLMATAARYDGFLMTPAQDGKRRFAGNGAARAFVNASRPPEGQADDSKWFLFTHPGLVISWYNGHPATEKLLREVGETMLDISLERKDFYHGYGGTAFYEGLYRMTGDERYLQALLDESQRKEGILAPRHTGPMEYALFDRLDDYDRKKTFDWLHQDAATRFATLATENMGSNDTRFEKNWAEWYLTKDKTYLNEGLAQLYRKLKFVVPALTSAEQSGDRVAITKQLISLAYLGGVPGARNRFFYPDFAVSYEGLSDNFAALVSENKTDSLQVLFYNFEARPQNGAIKIWHLIPGKYEVTAGPDADGDDKIDKVETVQEYSLERGASIPLVLPPQRTWIVQFKLLEKTTPLAERVDAGISRGLLRRDDNSLYVPVFNTGNKPIARLKVRLRSADGKQQQERIIENLPADAGWGLVSQEVQFPVADESGSWIVELDPDRSLEEITRANNRVDF